MAIPPLAEFMILSAIAKCPGIYAAEIPEYVSQLTDGAMTIPDGTLYSSIRRITEKGYIKCEEGPSPMGGGNRKHYRLSPEGMAVYAETCDLFRKIL